MADHASLQEYIGINPASDLVLPTENLNLLKQKGLTFTEMANNVISPRTLKHRNARGENLTPAETERAVRVARIIALAEEVFGKHDTALLWLRHHSDRLDGRTPMSFLNTEAGGRQIEAMLHGIAHGIYS